MNVFDFAIKMELDGKAFYEKMAKGTNLAGLQAIFSQLAADEQKHYEIFLALKSQTQATAMEDTTVLEQARNVFEVLLEQKETLGPIQGDLEGYRYAMKVEADSFRLYEDAAQKERNPDVKNLLLRIAGEERKHFSILQNILDFVNAPNQYLAWGEFSNIDEFRQFGRDVD
ncbi:MAG TPA: ferritin family protein [Desulfuromonadales bacterium]|nr:ferritin family protein [Desulfuromonadales bacterium]